MKKQFTNKRLFTVVLCVLLIALLSTTAFARLEKEEALKNKAKSFAAPIEVPKMYDTNGDKVFQNLEVQMTKAAKDETIPVIVMFKDNKTFARAQSTQIKGLISNNKVKHQFKNIPGAVMNLTKDEIAALAKDDTVAHIEYDQPVHAYMGTADKWFGTEKARSDFGLDGDRDGNPNSYTKNDVVVAVIDTGIDKNHVDLDGGKVIAWKDYVNNQSSAYDDQGHGTHVAGIVAGTGDGNSNYAGVAKGAALVGIKVLDSSGNGSMSNVTAAVDWCITNKDTYGIDVINMSLGTTGSSDGTDSTSVACNNAMDAGIVVVVAAGNSGPSKKTIGSPGAAEKVITVANMVDVGENGFSINWLSSRGPTADGRTKPDIGAPGTSIMAPKTNSTNGYVSKSGTSMASPFTAGTVALMLDANPNLTTTQVKNILYNTAIDWAQAGKDVDYGYGRLDGYAAIKQAGNYSGTNIAIPNHFTKVETMGGTGKKDIWTFDVNSTTYPIAITFITPDFTGSTWYGTPDFDVKLFSPSGSQLAYSWSGGRQETIKVTPSATGTYKLEVYSYKGSGDYFFDLTADVSNVTLTQDQ